MAATALPVRALAAGEAAARIGEQARAFWRRIAERVAQRLLEAVDAQARAAGKTVLVLDTVTGGDAERLYARSGWQAVGSIPNYALMPDGAFCATTVFHKQLPAAG